MTTSSLTIRIVCDPRPFSAAMLRARISCMSAQAHLDALSGDPAAKAWAAVVDALWGWVSEVPAPPEA